MTWNGKHNRHKYEHTLTIFSKFLVWSVKLHEMSKILVVTHKFNKILTFPPASKSSFPAEPPSLLPKIPS